ncbi:NAD(P) transhydrogenase subunit alpha [Parvularcula sp. ZS-1/3]|uniref:proton-translocating NAD(P)(+) transhydrogenase n=1 Tax=Parvularcula mediterranea TaxID=2732508 RepID=A0A7Y3RLB6_9PROT|nr:NAD(P) transhydrogenase subunit alpha [Parvularcula mediterranea]NNU16201.1 NAD(P) transhydrogenase subunit alpha [Parvularcula mediterranea]
MKQETHTEQTAEELEATVEELRAASEQLASASEEADAAAAKADSLLSALDAMAHAGGASGIVYLAAIFALACFVGYYVVWSVTPALHTPLMSVTNAVSSVVIVGALIAVGADVAQSPAGGWSRWLGVIAVALASVNIFGGFMVTNRMLAMYKKKEG